MRPYAQHALLTFLAAFAVLPVSAQPGITGGLAIQFYPSRTVHAYELEARRGLSSAVLQNASIVNRGADPIIVERIEIDLLAGGAAVQTTRLAAADLDKVAQRGAALEAQGMLAQLAFQFRPELILKDAKLAPGRELPPGGALLLGQRAFAFPGKPEALRLHVFGKRADGSAVEAAAELPIDFAGSKNEYDFPLAGTWVVGAGPTLHSHHRWAVPEEFALDIIRLGEGSSTHKGDGTKRTDYLAYGAPVRAAADGTVVAVVDGRPEIETDFRRPDEALEAYQQRLLENQGRLLAEGIEKTVGNHVVLAHANGEYSLYAHLQPGSIEVKQGAKVERGQPLGRVGTSGNSTEPHLHFQVMDGPDPLLAAGIPIRFQNVELPWSDSPRQVQTGDVVIAKP